MFSIGLLILCGIAYILYILIKSNKIGKGRAHQIGALGENEIARILNQLGLNGHVFNNLYIVFQNGKSTEIDLVFLTDKKVFVIESKNYSGIVFGDEQNRNWTVKYNGGKTFKLYNPIMQNNTHAMALVSRIGIPVSLINTIVVFGDNANISNVSCKDKCINTRDLGNYILNVYNTSNTNISYQGFKEIEHNLGSLTGVSTFTKINHINQIKKYHNK